jgi:hypothetical protein
VRQCPPPAQVAAAAIDGAQQVIEGDEENRAVVGRRRADRRAADTPSPARSAAGEIEAVDSPCGRADDDLVVERQDAGGRALERTRPQRATGGEIERDDAAVGQPEVERGQSRHRSALRHAAERHLPLQLAIGGAEGGKIAAFERDDEPPGVPVRRRRRRRGQRPLPQHPAARGVVGAYPTAHRPEDATVAHRRGPRRVGVGGPADPARVEVVGNDLAALHRHVGGRLVERRRRRHDVALCGDPPDVEAPPGEELEAGNGGSDGRGRSRRGRGRGGGRRRRGRGGGGGWVRRGRLRRRRRDRANQQPGNERPTTISSGDQPIHPVIIPASPTSGGHPRSVDETSPKADTVTNEAIVSLGLWRWLAPPDRGPRHAWCAWWGGEAGQGNTAASEAEPTWLF